MKIFLILLLVLMPVIGACQSKTTENKTMYHDTTRTLMMNPEYTSHLSEQEYDVLVNKATDRPGSYGYTDFFEEGIYHCRACGAELYKSDTKFHSGCGWPSFDAEIPGSVTRHTDRAFGMVRTEIVCANCGGHLGHVFEGEHFTSTNTRHCVNTSSIVFHPKNKKTCYIGVGQFYAAQSALQKIPGVLYTEVGYATTLATAPVYTNVEYGSVDAVEVVKVEYDPSVVTYKELLEKSAEVYTASQLNQFRLAFYTTSPEQHNIAESVMKQLQSSGKQVPQVADLPQYFKATAEHQNYQRKHADK